MIKSPLERALGRAYVAFVALAVFSEALVASSYFLNLPDRGAIAVLHRIAVVGFLNLLPVMVGFGSLVYGAPGWVAPSVQAALSAGVMALVVWGLRRGWRTKASIMALLIAPGLVTYAAWGFPMG